MKEGKRRSVAKYVLFGLFILIIAIKISSLNSLFIEKHYSNGIYPYIARFFRIIFGWIPFSIGDILYAAAGIYLIVKLFGLIKLLFVRPFKKRALKSKGLKLAFILSIVYLLFNLFWGLNYNRYGIGYQLQL